MSSSLLKKVIPPIVALVLGYGAHDALQTQSTVTGATLSAPPANSVRILYSLDAKQNDQQIIALINAARTKIYFAIYEFTLKDIADALVAAKQRRVDVAGLVDAGEAANSYDKPIIAELTNAGIPIETEVHPDGNGIMHIKAIVTDQAYALGSYNWTSSATKENDELLEIGTDETVRAQYEKILTSLLATYKDGAVTPTSTSASASNGTPQGPYPYTDANDHLGEYAAVTGTLVGAYASKSGTVFLDFCKSYKSCPFTAVIFSGDAKKFGDLSSLSGKPVTLTGTITSYQNQAEIVLSDPSQLAK